jgi:phosphate transport system protein
MREHTVKAFDQELADLKRSVGDMGRLAEAQLSKALDALARRDSDLAEEIIAADQPIDDLELAVEWQATQIIVKRQPMASDLRHIMVAIRIASDLERIGDLAKNLAKRTRALSDSIAPSAITGVGRMGHLALRQLAGVLDAYARDDAERALEIWRGDQDIDNVYNSVFRELLTYMMEDPRTIGFATHLMFAAKNMERIGDHCTNIAENIYYVVHGHPLAGERPKGDRTSTMATDFRPSDE